MTEDASPRPTRSDPDEMNPQVDLSVTTNRRAKSATSANATEERSIDLTSLIRALRRRRQLVIVSVGFTLCLSLLYCAFATRKYEAVAELAVHPEGSDSFDIGDLSQISGGGLDFQEKLETQVRFMKSNSLAWDVIKGLRLDQRKVFAGGHRYILWGPTLLTPPGMNPDNLAPDTKNRLIARFGKSLTVQSVPHTQAVDVMFRSADPELAKNVVNLLAQEYQRHNLSARFQATMTASEFLSGQLRDLKENVEKSQQKLADFQQKNGLIGSDENNNLYVSQLNDISKQLTDAEADRIVKEAKYRLALTGNPELVGTIVPDTVLPGLRAQEMEVKAKLAAADARFGERYPAVVQLKQQEAQTEASLQKEMRDIQARFKSEYDASIRTESQIKKSFEDRKQEAYRLAVGFNEYGILKRDLDAGRDLYEDLQRKLKESSVIAGLKAVNIDMIDPATLPTEPVTPNVPLSLAAGVFAGLVLGVGFAVVAEELDQTIKSPEELEVAVHRPPFAILPHVGAALPVSENGDALRNGSGVNSLAALQPGAEFSEACRALRTSLLLSSAGRPPKVVLVTSSMPGEGKSTVTSNLSAVLAQQSSKVLLVDADLRRGKIHERLDSDHDYGLANVIAGGVAWRKAIIRHPIQSGLDVLRGGTRPPNPAELLGSRQMKDLLDEWREAYDFVLLDTPPCLAVTDAVVLSTYADGVLVIARAQRTQRVAVARVVHILENANAPISGFVLNDFAAGEHYYGYGYQKEYLNYYTTTAGGDNGQEN